MSIIKRKAGSEDIVKSVLEFDAVPTEWSHNLVESGAVAQAIGNLGKPLIPIGTATVSYLNGTIEGLQPGWMYTLTDSGTLTAGSVEVEAGDEVAWGANNQWFKVGGESSKIAVFTGTYDHTATPPVFTGLPDTTAIAAAIDAGKYVVLLLTDDDTALPYVLAINNQGYKLFYRTAEAGLGVGYGTYHPGLVMTYGGPGNPWGWASTRFDVDRCLVISVFYDSGTSSYVWPSYSDIAAVYAGNIIVLDQSTPSGDHNTYILDEWSAGYYFHFIGKDGTWLKIDSGGSVSTGYIVSVHDGGSVAQSSGQAEVRNNTLTTITGVNTSTLEVSVTFAPGFGEVCNFALEIDPTVDCTLTLKRYVGSSPLTLTPSVAGGNVMTAGKHYQVTCVGSCWTLAEFAMP